MHVRSYIHPCIHAYMHTYIHTHIHIHTCMLACMHTYTCVRVLMDLSVDVLFVLVFCRGLLAHTSRNTRIPRICLLHCVLPPGPSDLQRKMCPKAQDANPEPVNPSYNPPKPLRPYSIPRPSCAQLDIESPFYKPATHPSNTRFTPDCGILILQDP